MEVTFTKEAIAQIEPKFTENKNRMLKLKYDTEDCGCVMCGVTALWLVEKPEEDDIRIETNGMPVYVEKTKMVFLDDKLTISFNETANCYMLKSPSQILNARMSLLIK
ncbi:heme biosynthesis protein HemY [Bacillus sp. 7586-K]|uniref:Uncharacterized protein YqkB n=1 Tax=Metabacillus niabensis TaxID=324854 RepID=A0ABT9YYE2_9BACI|nr:iron-sulfur cluster biosynthesis family protein [Metabacillus niabensis]MDQ0225012.1 uncharacterized protein YqkB [Metabacillus niabensis]PAD66530.1 heme biosynthesis protein HemY [Bacillus sp. 7586-K]